MTNNTVYNTYRGLAVFDTNLIRREDDQNLSIYLQNINQFGVNDIIEIVAGPKAQNLGTVIGKTIKKLKVLLEDGDVTTVLPRNTRLLNLPSDLPPGVIIPNTLAYNHSRISHK